MGCVAPAYVEFDDAIVSCIISLCFAMYHMDVIDVILLRMTPVNQCHFLNLLNRGCVRMVSYVVSSTVHYS